MITIRVPVLPLAQPRQRQRVITNKHTGKPMAMNYSPKSGPIQTFKATVRLAAQAAYSGPPLEGPLRVDLEFVFGRVQSQVWKSKPMPPLWHAKKPDRDNLDKAVMDALKGLLWLDDCQACDGRIIKRVAAGDEAPHVTIRVSQLSALPATRAELDSAAYDYVDGT